MFASVKSLLCLFPLSPQLESLLIDAFKGKGYQKISDLLQERETDTLQKYSSSLLSQLDKALRRVSTTARVPELICL